MKLYIKIMKKITSSNIKSIEINTKEKIDV